MLSRLFRLCPSAPRFHPSLSLPLCRSYTPDPAHLFVQKYNRKKQEHLALVHPTLTEVESFGLTQPNEVFINNELNLSYIDVYGFDYDYTLANYTDKLSKTIYQILRDILIDHLRYPAGLRALEFDPNFAVRGLHYDFRNGWLMKVDSFSKIQLNTVYVGREPIKNPDQIVQLHNGIHISPHYLNANMNQLNDLFSIPESCLLSDVCQYFNDHEISFHPSYLSDDVRTAVRILYSGTSRGGIGGLLHHRVMENVEMYLERSPKLVQYLENLRKGGKKLFLLTNSSFPFVDRGLAYITGRTDWRELFDAVVVSADKPNFYRSNRPFRRITESTWAVVDAFHRGEVYQGGNLLDFSRFTGWRGQRVMYIGDHVFSDLEEPNIQQGWRTGAIIRELQTEIQIRNTPSYRQTLSWLLHLENLIRQAQTANMEQRTPELQHLLDSWRNERRNIRRELKIVFNRQFGSVFRTHHNPTWFANKIKRFADVYTSNLENFDNYPLDYMFYPERTYLPHERLVETLVDSGRIKK